jgi:hypothetical protein
MKKQLTILYDKTGDILYVNTCKPYPEQESEELRDEIIARLNPTSGTVENLEILFFAHRTQPLNLLELPIAQILQPII